MGRGRKGLIEQIERKKKATGAYRETFTFISAPKRQIKKIIVHDGLLLGENLPDAMLGSRDDAD